MDEEASNGDRIKATEIVLDRVLGKALQHVSMDVLVGQPPWMKALAASITSLEDLRTVRLIVNALPGETNGEIVEGKVVEEELVIFDEEP